MKLSDYHLQVLNYFYNQFDNYLSEKEAPSDIAGLGYRQEFADGVYQLVINKLLEKEVPIGLFGQIDDKYRVTKEGKRLILKSKTDEEIKHIILGFLRTDGEREFGQSEVEKAIPIERDQLVYLLDEMKDDNAISIILISGEDDNCLIHIKPKGIRSFVKSAYLITGDKPARITNGEFVNYARIEHLKN